MLIVRKDDDLLNESGFLRNDNIRLYEHYKKLSNEQNEDHLDYIKHAEEVIFEKLS